MKRGRIVPLVANFGNFFLAHTVTRTTTGWLTDDDGCFRIILRQQVPWEGLAGVRETCLAHHPNDHRDVGCVRVGLFLQCNNVPNLGGGLIIPF